MCSGLSLLGGILFPIFGISGFVVILHIIYQTVKLHRQEKNPVIKPLLCLYFTGLLYMLLRVPVDIYGCIDKTSTLFTMGKRLRQLVSIINWYALIWVLYNRLLIVFKDSVHKLAKKTKIIFKMLYTAPVIIIFIYVPIYYATNRKYIIIVIAAGIVYLGIFIGMSLWLIILFGIKLKRLFKEINALDEKNEEKDSNEELRQMMTKYFILCTISLGISILSLLFYGIIFGIDDGKESSMIQDIQDLLTFMFMFDVFTNVYCVYLQSASKNDLYFKVCGCMDRWCQAKWDKNDNEREISKTVTTSSPAISSNESNNIESK